MITACNRSCGGQGWGQRQWSVVKAHEDRQSINVSIKRGSYHSKFMLSPFHLHIHACLDCPFPPS
jgi:hypothetical protein